MKYATLRIGFLVAALGCAVAPPAVARQARTILIVFSNGRLLPANVQAERGVQAAIANAATPGVEAFAEFLDVPHFGGDAYSRAVATYLKDKYVTRPPDVILAGGEDALRFLLLNRATLFPHTPIVHMGVSQSNLGTLPPRPPDVIGVPVEYQFSATIDQALRWHPRARHLVIVTGTSPEDREWEARLRVEVARFSGRVTPEFLAGLPTDTLLQRLRKLGRDAVVFTPGYYEDGAGRYMTPRESAEFMARASAAPVYGPFDTFIGTGIVGGRMMTFESMGRQGGEIAMRLLLGARADTLTLPTTVPAELHLDWRQAHRWGIDNQQMPEGTVWQYREPTLWEAHRLEVLLATALILIQAGLIVALLLERRSRRKAVFALQDSEERMSLAAHAAELSLWTWDFSTDRFWATQGSWRPFGSPLERPLGLADALEHVHPSDRDVLETALRQAAADASDFDAECRLLRPDGEVRWIVARGRVETEKGPRLLGVTLDVTSRKRAEMQAERDRAELRHMTRVSMLGQLSASIAHQMNQPLAAILGNAEAMGKMLGNPSLDVVELRATCDDIVTEGFRAAEIVRRLRGLFRRGELRLEPVGLNGLLRETLELAQSHLLSRQVSVVLDLAPHQPTVDGDRVQLQQTLLNLILNAADAMCDVTDRARTLTLRSEVDDVAARLTVIDCGPGIDSDNLASVFEPFWTTKPGGMGIGLAMCQSIITAHHGTLTVSSDATGATFCVTLPARGGM